MNKLHKHFECILKFSSIFCVCCGVITSVAAEKKVILNKKLAKTSYAVDYKTYSFSSKEMAKMFELEKLTDYTIYRRANDWNSSRKALLSLLEESTQTAELIKVLVAESEKRQDLARLTDDFVNIINRNPLKLRLSIAAISLLVKQKQITKAFNMTEKLLHFFNKNPAVLSKLNATNKTFLETLAIVYCELNSINEPNKKNFNNLKFIQSFPVVGDRITLKSTLLKFYGKAITHLVNEAKNKDQELLLSNIYIQHEILLDSIRALSSKEYIAGATLKQILLSLNKLKGAGYQDVAEEIMLNNLIYKPDDFLTLTYLSLHYGKQGKFSLAHDLWIRVGEVYRVALYEKMRKGLRSNKKIVKKLHSKDKFYMFLALDMAIKGNLQDATYTLARKLNLIGQRFDKKELPFSNLTTIYTYSAQSFLMKYEYDKAYEIATIPLDEERNNFLLGDILMRLGKYSEARDVFEQFLNDLEASSIPKDKVVKYFLISYLNCLDSLNAYDAMLKVLESYSKIFAEDVTWNNYYGYTLVEKGVRLEFAETLIRKSFKLFEAIVKDKKQLSTNENLLKIAVMDSLAWCLFKQNKTDEAVVVVNNALNVAKNEKIWLNSVVLDHFADIFFANKQYADAEKLWEKVLEVYEDNFDYEKIKQKIANVNEVRNRK